MIWLHEITRERFNTDLLNLVDRTSECDIYFLDDADTESWLTENHDKYAIKPMRNLMAAFLDVLREQPGVDPDFVYEAFDHANFGEYFKNKGHKDKIFDDPLSGVQLRISIQFYKDLSCVEC
jgi:hypothetical protein